MIILSQDRKKIINFNNIIEINVNYEKQTNIIAWSGLEGDQGFVDLGEYKTEERAKEVLREIAEIRSLFELAKCRLIDEKTLKDYGDIQDIETLLFDTYEMPLE